MARFDKCRICDYSEAEGSSFSGVRPGANGRVSKENGTLCDVCYYEQEQAVIELNPVEEIPDEEWELE